VRNERKEFYGYWNPHPDGWRPRRLVHATRRSDKVMRMASRVQWHGTRSEGLELMHALSRHCSCVFGAHGLRASVCAPHQMCSDQRAVDGLLFSRRIAARLRNEEFHPCETTTEVVARS
jgi:hypothetical protein